MDHSKLVIVVLIVLALLYTGTIGLGLKRNGKPSENNDQQAIARFKDQNPGTTTVLDGLGRVMGSIAPALGPDDLSPRRSTLSPPPGERVLSVTINPSDNNIRFARLYLAVGNQATITYQPKIPNSMKFKEKKAVTLYRQGVGTKPVARPVGPINMTIPRTSSQTESAHRRVAGSMVAQSGGKRRGKLMIYGEGGTLRVDCSGCQVQLQ